MRIVAAIKIEIEAADFVAAADHQQTLEALLAQVRSRYPEASLAIRERRRRRAAVKSQMRAALSTGAVQEYEG